MKLITRMIDRVSRFIGKPIPIRGRDDVAAGTIEPGKVKLTLADTDFFKTASDYHKKFLLWAIHVEMPKIPMMMLPPMLPDVSIQKTIHCLKSSAVQYHVTPEGQALADRIMVLLGCEALGIKHDPDAIDESGHTLCRCGADSCLCRICGGTYCCVERDAGFWAPAPDKNMNGYVCEVCLKKPLDDIDTRCQCGATLPVKAHPNHATCPQCGVESHQYWRSQVTKRQLHPEIRKKFGI